MRFGELLLMPEFVGVFRQHHPRHLYSLKEEKAAPSHVGGNSQVIKKAVYVASYSVDQ